MTLFMQANPSERVFRDALAKYFAGQPDRATLDILAESSRADDARG